MSQFWSQYGKLNENIADVSQLIRETLKCRGNESVQAVIDHLLSSEGKYLRAGLTILCGQAGDGDETQLISAAAAFEMLHMATLVHDDIIDDSRMRRGLESVQSKFGKDVAVYAGDYILARAFRFITERHLEFLSPLSRGIEAICAGEIRQNMNRYNQQITYKEYLKIIAGKTAALFYMCARAGGQIAGMEPCLQKNLANSARHAGMAFQIIDDCRDYECDRAALRKEPESDIENGIYTLPLIFALKNGELSDLEGDTKQTALFVQQSKGLREARKTAEAYTKKALKELGRLPSNKQVQQIAQMYKKITEA